MTLTAPSTGDEERSAAGDDVASPVAATGDSMTVAAWTMVSRATGVIKVAAIGAVLGPTFFGNVYQFSNSLPNLVYYGFLAGSLFASLLVPALVAHLDSDRQQDSARVAGGFLGVVALGLAAVVPVVALLAPVLLRITSADRSGGSGAEQQRLAQALVVMLLPQVFCYAVVGSSTAIMNARRRFALAAAAPAIENIGTIAVLLVSLVVYGRGRDIGAIPTGQILLLGLGSTGAVAVHAGVQWWGARRAGVLLRPRPGWRDPEVRALVRRAMRSLGQAGLYALQIVAMLLVANRVRGGVVAMQIALNFYALPIAIGATPVALSVLPRLARTFGQGDGSAFHAIYVRGVSLALFVAVPAGLGYLILAQPMAHAVAFGALGSAQGVTLIAISIAALAIGIPGQTAFQVSSYGAYARHDTATPLRVMAVQAASFFVLAVPAIFIRGAAVLAVLGAAYSAANVLSAVLMHRLLQTRGVLSSERLGRSLLRTTSSALVMIVPTWVLSVGISAITDGRSRAMGELIGGTMLGLLTYLAAQAWLGAPELSWARHSFRRRGRPVAQQGCSSKTTSGTGQSEGSPTETPSWRTRGSLSRRRPAARFRRRSIALFVATLTLVPLLATLLAVAVVAAPVLAVAACVVIALATAVWRRPVLAAYSVIGLTPLLCGIDRGVLIPVFRPNEGVALFVAMVLSLRGLVRLRSGAVPRLRVTRVEVAVLLMAICNSIVPLIWMKLIDRPITSDDISYALVLWKYFGVYLIVRFSVRELREVERCLYLSIAAAAVVGVVAILQSLGLFGVRGVLSTFYASYGNTAALSNSRGSSTLGLPAAVADLMIYNLALSLGLMIRLDKSRVWLGAVSALFVLSTLAAGEFSSTIGLVIGALAIVGVTGSLALLRYFAPVAALGGAAMWPVIETRLAGFQSASGLPVSWTGRLYNLQNYFWPTLFSHGNFLLGVRPAARMANGHKANQFVWIESGYSWCLWGGGIPLLLSFLYFLYAAGQDAWRTAVRRIDAVGVAATGTFASLVVMSVLMIFDPHLTYRGAADALFASLALMRVAGGSSDGTAERGREPAGTPVVARPSARALSGAEVAARPVKELLSGASGGDPRTTGASDPSRARGDPLRDIDRRKPGAPGDSHYPSHLKELDP